MPICLLVSVQLRQPVVRGCSSAVSCLSEGREYKLAPVEQISISLKSRAAARIALGVKQEV